MCKRVVIAILISVHLLLFSPVAHAGVIELDFFELFKEHGSIMLIMDVETGSIEYANQAAVDFYGYTEEQLENMTIQQINTLNPAEVEAERREAAAERRNHFIFRHRLANGEIRTVRVYSYPYDVGERVLLFSVISDITAMTQLQEGMRIRNNIFYAALSGVILMLFALLIALTGSWRRGRKMQTQLGESERKYFTLLSNLPGMAYRCKNDADWTMEFVSSGCLQLTGYRPEDLTSGKITLGGMIHKKYRKVLWDKWQDVLEKKVAIQHEYVITSADGKEKWVWEQGRGIYSENGVVIALEGFITDITEKKISENKVLENEEKLYATLLSVGDGVICTDSNGRIELMNPLAQQLTGWSQLEASGKPFEEVFNIFNEYTRDKCENPVKMVFETEKIIELANHTMLLSKSGEEIAIEDTAAPIRDKFGHITGVVVVFRDFTEKRKKQQKIEYLSYHDQLTGLYNRRFMEEEIKRLDTSRNLPFTIVVADVNGLKVVNDAFGHAAGDLLLQKAAHILKSECRADDIIARMGGDEFVILLPKSDSNAVGHMLKRVKSIIENERINGVDLSISFGWETKNADDTAIAEVLTKAESQMYQNKIFENSSRRSTVIKSILNTLNIRSAREAAHSERVGKICVAIGSAYNLNEDDIKELSMAGELHDIGKIVVDEAILNRVGALTDAEWAYIKRHPEVSYRLLSTFNEFYSIAEYVFAHHERWDGKGYPKGLEGEVIPWKARIIALADAYDAMTGERTYRKALSEEEAVDEIRKNAGTQFDPCMAKVFVEKVLGRKW